MSAHPAPGAVLGVIADDFTGATDVASMLVREGLRTVQLIGVPGDEEPVPAGAAALVVALKSRTIPAAEAVAMSLAALRWLQRAGVRQVYFKVCSTFDSTPAGNIGPVADALMRALDAPFTVVTPAFPENGRTVFRGHLFVGEQLLSESGMRHHPLTPMTDANLVRVLQAQTTRRVGLLARDPARRGVSALRERAAALQQQGVAMAMADAVDDDDLRDLAEVAAPLPLVVAGSGLAKGLPLAFAERGWVRRDTKAANLPKVGGLAAVLAGSCSTATLAQVAAWREAGRPALALDVRGLLHGEPVVEVALAWARERLNGGAVLIHSSLPAAELQALQAEAGGALAAGERVEQAMARLAAGLVEAGVQRLVVAGGETSGAAVQALGVRRLQIGAAICPGVPWTMAEGRPLWLALKSGNFGGPGFFAEALALSEGA